MLFETARYHKLFFATDASIIISPALEEKRRIIQNAVVEGPYDTYIAFSRKLADEKGIKGGLVPGEVDIALLPDLDAANAVYKTLTFFGEGLQSAAIVAGARFPIILPSRTDPPRPKMLSIALASFLKMQVEAI